MTRSDVERLRSTVWVIIDELRLAGQTPDQMIDHLNGVLADPSLGVHRQALSRCVIPWMVERYFPRQPAVDFEALFTLDRR